MYNWIIEDSVDFRGKKLWCNARVYCFNEIALFNYEDIDSDNGINVFFLQQYI